jgi:hypothetical protein
MKLLFTILLFFTARFVSAQYGVTGGLSFLRPFGIQSTFVGFKLGGEIPRDNENSLYVNASFYGKKRLDPSVGTTTIQLENIDPNDYSLKFVSTDSYFNYITVDGGNRYYLIDGYDGGFALYGGSNLMGIINQAKMKVSDFDQTKYRLPSGESLNGTVLSLGVGFTGGAKYTVPAVGTFFIDVVADYLILAVSSNQTASNVAQQFYSPIIFSFNFGFRKDLY